MQTIKYHICFTNKNMLPISLFFVILTQHKKRLKTWFGFSPPSVKEAYLEDFCIGDQNEKIDIMRHLSTDSACRM